jgi:hypothetical protein
VKDRLRYIRGLQEIRFGSHSGFELRTLDYIASKLPEIIGFAIHLLTPDKIIQQLYASKISQNRFIWKSISNNLGTQSTTTVTVRILVKQRVKNQIRLQITHIIILNYIDFIQSIRLNKDEAFK